MAKALVSDFDKKDKPKGDRIPWTKVSIQNSQLLISSGIPSLDSILGGGLPVGSLVLIDEDKYGKFAEIFMKCFLAEGILSKQAVNVCSKDVSAERLISELPGLAENEEDDNSIEDDRDEEMKIAWRYQNMKSVSSSFANQRYIGHLLDLTKKLGSSLIQNSDISQWSKNEYSEVHSYGKSDFAFLLKSIKEKLENENYFINSAQKEKKILRLGLFQIGSPLWPASDKYLPIFLYSLRALLRNSFSTCMITVPFHLYENEDLKSKCVHLSDICMKLESFSGTKLEENKAFNNYNGFFRILKWAAINGLVNGRSRFTDMAIKLRRKTLVIEKLHLPPELEETAETDEIQSSHMMCSSVRSKFLEF